MSLLYQYALFSKFNIHVTNSPMHLITF